MDASMPNPQPAFSEKCTLRTDAECQAEDKLDEILRQVKLLTRAFPEDEFGEPDVVWHRRLHEKQIEAAEANRLFWIGMRNDVIRRGILWGLILVSGLIATGIMIKARAVVLKIIESR